MAGLAGEFIGISTTRSHSQYYFLRFHLGAGHLERFAGSQRFLISGQAANGFIIAPDRKGLKIQRGTLVGGAYLQTTLTHFELSRRIRRRVNVRAEFEGGHLRVPPLPPAWIDAAAEFDPHAPDSDEAPAEFGGESIPLNGAPTAPLPKPAGDYGMPTDDGMDASMAELQAQLAQQLNASRDLIGQMEARTGMKFVLDRHLRLVVAL